MYSLSKDHQQQTSRLGFRGYCDCPDDDDDVVVVAG